MRMMGVGDESGERVMPAEAKTSSLSNDGSGLRVVQQGALARLRSAYEALPAAERLVAQFIEEYPEDTVRLPIKSLAQRIGVSHPTIIRCARSLGYQGLRDLKLALAAEVPTLLDVIHEDIQPDDDALTIAKKMLQSDIQAIADTLAILDGREWERAAAALLTASYVEFYGVAQSGAVATGAYTLFRWMGLPVAVVTDPNVARASAAHLRRGMVAFAVSHSGQSPETLRSFRRAHETGATCILLTSRRGSPIGRYADIELVTAARETAFGPDDVVASRTVLMSVVEALYVTVMTQRYTESLAAIRRSDEVSTAAMEDLEFTE